jgi:hypothetical protein
MCKLMLQAGRVWMRALGLAGLLVTFFSPVLHAGSSSIEAVNCGQILTREFDEAHQIHDYKIMMTESVARWRSGQPSRNPLGKRL